MATVTKGQQLTTVAEASTCLLQLTTVAEASTCLLQYECMMVTFMKTYGKFSELTAALKPETEMQQLDHSHQAVVSGGKTCYVRYVPARLVHG